MVEAGWSISMIYVHGVSGTETISIPPADDLAFGR